MPRVSLAFFGAGVLCVLAGMAWGVAMGAQQNFLMAPAHAHLNLLGFVTLSIMGTFYALAGERASSRLAWTNFTLSFVGVVVMIPLLAEVLMAETNQPGAIAPAATLGPLMIVPEGLVIAGMLCFLGSIVKVWRSSSDTAAPVAAARMAAE